MAINLKSMVIMSLTFLVVEILSSDQNSGGVVPKEGDRLHVSGTWITDKLKAGSKTIKN